MRSRRAGRARRALALPDRAPPRLGQHKSCSAVARRGQTPHRGDLPLPWRGQLPHRGMSRPRPRHHQRDQRHSVHADRRPAPRPHPLTGRRADHPRGGDSRPDSTKRKPEPAANAVSAVRGAGCRSWVIGMLRGADRLRRHWSRRCPRGRRTRRGSRPTLPRARPRAYTARPGFPCADWPFQFSVG